MLAIDYLGHGYTDKPKIDYNLDAFSKHLLDFMDAAGIKKAHLVGESQGGQISVLTAYEHPERVDKLGLIVGGIPSNEHDYVSGQKRLQELTRDATGTPTKETIRKRMEWLFHDPKILPDELVDIRLKIYSDPAMQYVLHTRDRKVYDLIEKIPKIQAPILFSGPPTTPPVPGRWPTKCIRACQGQDSSSVDKSGHWPQYERPEEFNRTLLEFLDDSLDEILIDTYRRRYW